MAVIYHSFPVTKTFVRKNRVIFNKPASFLPPPKKDPVGSEGSGDCTHTVTYTQTHTLYNHTDCTILRKVCRRFILFQEKAGRKSSKDLSSNADENKDTPGLSHAKWWIYYLVIHIAVEHGNFLDDL